MINVMVKIKIENQIFQLEILHRVISMVRKDDIKSRHLDVYDYARLRKMYSMIGVITLYDEEVHYVRVIEP